MPLAIAHEIADVADGARCSTSARRYRQPDRTPDRTLYYLPTYLPQSSTCCGVQPTEERGNKYTTRRRGRHAPGRHSFATQRIACALTRAVATPTEVAHALTLPTACDPRTRLAGG